MRSKYCRTKMVHNSTAIADWYTIQHNKHYVKQRVGTSVQFYINFDSKGYASLDVKFSLIEDFGTRTPMLYSPYEIEKNLDGNARSNAELRELIHRWFLETMFRWTRLPIANSNKLLLLATYGHPLQPPLWMSYGKRALDGTKDSLYCSTFWQTPRPDVYDMDIGCPKGREYVPTSHTSLKSFRLLSPLP